CPFVQRLAQPFQSRGRDQGGIAEHHKQVACATPDSFARREYRVRSAQTLALNEGSCLRAQAFGLLLDGLLAGPDDNRKRSSRPIWGCP
ncbi:MAG TPA: hypothetical protein VKH44_00565, partial [Pirellulaceae bacterium]|nr:hypothetical protein [Pirellulaceae bacterium]